MTDDIIFSHKYIPLFEILEGKHPEVDTVIISGGRGSGKSFVSAIFSITALTDYDWDILYTRFTNVSIVDSIKPEVDDKIELLHLEYFVNSTNTHIENANENRIAFKGIKTGSKQQTANLKSLSGFNCFVVDEAEELPDFETYEKVFLSIRSGKKQNVTILMLNPPHASHWIYKHFFEDKNVAGGSNLKKDNIIYIHTSYLDVERKYLAPNIVRYYEEMKKNDPERYDHVVLGKWKEGADDRVFDNWNRINYSEYKKIDIRPIYGVDWGKNHGFGIVETKFDKYHNNLYAHELNWKSENELIAELPLETQNRIKQSTGGIIVHTFTKLNIPKDAIIVCDSAVPDNIILLRRHGWEYAVGVKKPKGSVMSGISLLHSTNVFYTDISKGIHFEYNNYEYNRDRMGVIDDEVKPVNDDLIDPIRYVRYHIEKEILS